MSKSIYKEKICERLRIINAEREMLMEILHQCKNSEEKEEKEKE